MKWSARKPMFNLKFQETCGSCNGPAVAKDWRTDLLGGIVCCTKFISPRHWLTCKLNIPSVQDQQHKGLVLLFGSTNASVGALPPNLFLSNYSRIDLFPQYPIERSVLNFFLSLKVFESEFPTTTVGETWHRFFRWRCNVRSFSELLQFF